MGMWQTQTNRANRDWWSDHDCGRDTVGAQNAKGASSEHKWDKHRKLYMMHKKWLKAIGREARRENSLCILPLRKRQTCLSRKWVSSSAGCCSTLCHRLRNMWWFLKWNNCWYTTLNYMQIYRYIFYSMQNQMSALSFQNDIFKVSSTATITNSVLLHSM
jgi:hypothetical protein